MPEQERVDENTMLVTVGDLNKMARSLKRKAIKLESEAAGPEQGALIRQASVFRTMAQVLRGEEEKDKT